MANGTEKKKQDERKESNGSNRKNFLVVINKITMGTDADALYASLAVPDPMFPEPYVCGPVFMSASGSMFSEQGNILLDGTMMNSCLTDRASLKLNGSSVNLSCTSMCFNNSSMTVSGTMMNVNSGITLTSLTTNGVPVVTTAPPTGSSWASTGRLYIYTNNNINYLCVV